MDAGRGAAVACVSCKSRCRSFSSSARSLVQLRARAGSTISSTCIEGVVIVPWTGPEFLCPRFADLSCLSCRRGNFSRTADGLPQAGPAMVAQPLAKSRVLDVAIVNVPVSIAAVSGVACRALNSTQPFCLRHARQRTSGPQVTALFAIHEKKLIRHCHKTSLYQH